MVKRFAFVLLLIVAASPLWADGACSQEAIKQTAARAKKAQSALLALKVSTQTDAEVTPAMQKLIREFKDQLVATVDGQIACEGTESDATTLERKLATALGANKPEDTSAAQDDDRRSEIDQVYGDGLSIRASRPEDHPQLLLVESTFGIKCGSDSVLLVYERAPHTWHRVVRWQSGDYEDISGAFGDFFNYVVVPQSASGDWVVAVAHGVPWCTSRWSGFKFDIIVPARENSPQRVLFHKDEGYVRFAVAPVMKAKPDGFELRLEVGSIDIDTMTRPGVYRYRVGGEKAERVQPIAMNGRGFVDEWLQVEWADASRWSDPQNLKQLKTEHDRIGQTRGGKNKNSVSLSYGPVRTCSDDRNHFQAQENEEAGDPLYFQIKQIDNGYMMMSISYKADPACKGPDIMRKRQ